MVLLSDTGSCGSGSKIKFSKKNTKTRILNTGLFVTKIEAKTRDFCSKNVKRTMDLNNEAEVRQERKT